MVEVSSPVVAGAARVVVATAVSRLWWGAMFMFIDLRINGWDLVPDVIGMVLITGACRDLWRTEPHDPAAGAGLVLAVATLLGTVLYSIPTTRDAFPAAVMMTSVLAQVGIVVVAAHLATRTRYMGLDEIARRWRAAAQFQGATTVAMAVFFATAAIFGGFSLDVPEDEMFEWAIEDSVGLVALTLVLAVGLIGAVLWVRAAWSVWRRLP